MLHLQIDIFTSNIILWCCKMICTLFIISRVDDDDVEISARAESNVINVFFNHINY